MIAGVADTHTALWYLLKSPLLSAKARQFMDDAAASGNDIVVSPISLAEIVYLEIPNINCTKCTLQVIEFMAAHGFNKDGGYTYHHCADLQVRANPNKPVDTRFPVENKRH